jgi:predicted enzyme related to lactoylglutathione lyase
VALITPFPVMSPMGGTIRQEQPGSGSPPAMVYVGVPDVTAALEQIVAAGGKVHAPRFEVPGTVVLGLFNDPAGNAMGLVEMDGDKPKIP